MWSKSSPRAARIVFFALILASCRAHPNEPQFPQADRPVAPIVGGTFSTEDARDRAGEAEEVMQLAGVKPGMSVADVGAGEGYYTVRLARVVGPKGRVLAEDIVPEVRDAPVRSATGTKRSVAPARATTTPASKTCTTALALYPRSRAATLSSQSPAVVVDTYVPSIGAVRAAPSSASA